MKRTRGNKLPEGKIIAIQKFDEPITITEDMTIKTSYNSKGMTTKVIDKDGKVVKTGFAPYIK